jgi:hypothetical protein
MCHPARHDDELTGPDLHLAVRQLYAERALDDEEQLVGIVVMMPDELALGPGESPTAVGTTCWPFSSPTRRGRQWSAKRANFSARLTTAIMERLLCVLSSLRLSYGVDQVARCVGYRVRTLSKVSSSRVSSALVK